MPMSITYDTQDTFFWSYSGCSYCNFKTMEQKENRFSKEWILNSKTGKDGTMKGVPWIVISS